MSSGDQSWQSLAEMTANRLRLLQADVADESGEVRREVIAEEIERALSKIIPPERELFLEYVEERFPNWEGGMVVNAAAVEDGGGSARVSATDMNEFNDPSFLLRQLCKLAGSMSDEKKLAAARELARHGISVSVEGGLPPEETERAKATVGLRPNAVIDPARLIDLTTVLTELAMSLDQVVWATWKQVSPKSLVRRRAELQQTFAKFVEGDDRVGRDLVQEDLARLRQLTAAMISATGKAGSVMTQHLQRFQPAMIEGTARNEKGRFESIEAACWKKFTELSEGLDPASVESEVKKAVADYTENLMRSRMR